MKYLILLGAFCGFLRVSGNAQQLKALSAGMALAEVDTLLQLIRDVHVNPYLHNSQQVFDTRVRAIKATIRDSVSLPEHLLNLQRITALLNDGHTMPAIVQPAFIPELRQPVFLPAGLILYQGGLYASAALTQAYPAVPTGAEIRAINGRPVRPLIQDCLSLFGGPEPYRAQMTERLLSYYLFLNGIRPPFQLKDATGRHARIDSGSTFKATLWTTMPHLRTPNRFRILNDTVGELQFYSMSGNLDTWGSLLDSTFRELRVRNIRSLYIDIRNNPGGNSLFANYLLAYLTQEKLALSGGKCWRISERYKAYQRQQGDSTSEYQQQLTGSRWCFGSCTPETNPVIADTVFEGTVKVLTGPFTFSSANMLADAVKTFNLASLVGAPTGEYTNDFGETMTVTLPISKLMIQLTTSFDYGADCDRATFKVVTPDVRIEPTLAERISGTDVVYRYLLHGSAHQ